MSQQSKTILETVLDRLDSVKERIGSEEREQSDLMQRLDRLEDTTDKSAP